jgi:hypothetical protein
MPATGQRDEMRSPLQKGDTASTYGWRRRRPAAAATATVTTCWGRRWRDPLPSSFKI